MLPQVALSALLALMPVLVSSSPAPRPAAEVVTEVEARDIEKRSFHHSCSSCRIGPMRGNLGITYHLQCQCAPHSEAAWTWVDLDSCFANRDGWLRWENNGRGLSSCQDARLENGRELVASCRAISGAWMNNRIGLDERIHNRNGVLRCEI